MDERAAIRRCQPSRRPPHLRWIVAPPLSAAFALFGKSGRRQLVGLILLAIRTGNKSVRDFCQVSLHTLRIETETRSLGVVEDHIAHPRPSACRPARSGASPHKLIEKVPGTKDPVQHSFEVVAGG